ncbi:acyl-CoA thioesterase [Paenibacillus sp. NPDC058071]|uniref:acyl-CoA thioesterase n=1 Tax=Paenibacillus sp. NPDC058071 TaxID=3346326 RepID=UPI0036DD97FF
MTIQAYMQQWRPSAKPASDSRTEKASIVLPPDTNQSGLLTGDRLTAYMDEIAEKTAFRHSGLPVSASSDEPIDCLNPIRLGDSFSMTAFVTWTNRSTMEVYVRSFTEDWRTGKQTLCAATFRTFIAMDANGKPAFVPQVLPETEEEITLFKTIDARLASRRHSTEENLQTTDLGTVENFSNNDAFPEETDAPIHSSDAYSAYAAAWSSEW